MNHGEKVLESLKEFMYNLNGLFPKPVEEITISIPEENFHALRNYLIANKWIIDMIQQVHYQSELKVPTHFGTINLTTPALENKRTEAKLQECFKILSAK